MVIQIIGSVSRVTIISGQVHDLFSNSSTPLTAHIILGPISILPLRRLYIERQIQPEMLSFVSTEEVVALFNMLVFYPIHISKLIFQLL